MKDVSFLEFREAMLSCEKCRLRDSCTQVVPGEGNPKADIVFVGEGPGKKEDKTGTPFVGAAGKMLEKLLASIEMSRDSVYIANVVKCRPPNNRDPLPDEIVACRPWLDEQIQRINPKLIVTLGRYAAHAFWDETEFRMSRDHGTVREIYVDKLGKRLILALYHPAAALYNGSLRETLFRDFATIPKVLQSLDKR
jgi:DNA polymerase